MSASICWHCQRAIMWHGGGWVHSHSLRSTCYAPNGDARTATLRPDPCVECRRGFSIDEWDVRHTASDGIGDVHEQCCRQCSKLPTLERPSVTENTARGRGNH